MTRWFARVSLILAVGLVFIVGCTTVPGVQDMKRGRKAYKKGDTVTALTHFGQAEDVNGPLFQRKKFAEHLQMYQDSQMTYGMGQGQQAENEGRLFDAWVWYAQVAGVDKQSDRCRGAAQEATRVRANIGPTYLERAQDAQSSGDLFESYLLALRSCWYGAGEENQQYLEGISEASDAAMDARTLYQITEKQFEGPVRVQTLARIAPKTDFTGGWGIPIYYGEPQRYYVLVAHVSGPAMYTIVQKALRKKKKGADALINVGYRHTGRDQVLWEGDAVKFLNLGLDGAAPKSGQAQDGS